MLLSYLVLIPIIGSVLVASVDSYKNKSILYIKKIALSTSALNLIISLIVFILFHNSSNQFQFVQEHYNIQNYDLFLGVDGISIYFILLTTIIMPIALLSNWSSIKENVKSYLIIMLLLETLLLIVFMASDIMLFYIFFESILPPLFLLIGIFGSDNKVSASYYLFLYTFNLKCKRAKDRGSPKALVTKVVKETFQLAWLMPQGMVRSLVFNIEKLLLVVDIWVIAVLSHPCFIASITSAIPRGVKEQRVDGSSDSRILDSVRCTLVAGKPVLGRKIHSHYYNNRISDNMFNRSMHTTTSTLDPWFVTGLVEAEGCFMLGLYKSDDYRMGYRVQAIFKTTLHEKDQTLLCQLQNYFGVGKITRHGKTTLQYTVKSLKDLERIVSHFDTYPLLSQKCADYTLFKEAVTIIRNKEHLNREGFMKVISIRASMNLGLSDELQLSFPDIKPFPRPCLLNKSNPNPYWIAGLASGVHAGCFHISIRNSFTTTLGKSVVLKFHIVQHCRDTELMELLISTLGCGKIELLLKQSAVYFVVVKFQDIFEKIIPLFDKYPIQGIKALDYSDFKKVVYLIHNKEHLTEQGLSEIQSIKLNMNLFRKF